MNNTMVSVSSVKVSPDLSVAKAYLSVFPSEQAAEVIENVNRQAKTVRYELARRTRYQLRRCPELQFYLDDSIDYLENIDRLLGDKKTGEE